MWWGALALVITAFGLAVGDLTPAILIVSVAGIILPLLLWHWITDRQDRRKLAREVGADRMGSSSSDQPSARIANDQRHR